MLGDPYGSAKDRFAGYYRKEPIAGSDGPTFTRVDTDYAKDKGPRLLWDVRAEGRTTNRFSGHRFGIRQEPRHRLLAAEKKLKIPKFSQNRPVALECDRDGPHADTTS